ncbi:response regulator transcription factor [Catenuloplanes atrovinosus]|uniref:DNA-binding NarL/FixJ family response regulator n=1 Tax=Catenuloplanes atrovinosus TaxID=137266 RepID=A0AAE3YS73_9ACTN|nr:response regulator transcription factor [Catenuloplanes atrovinosus]MDR7276831.1 DNA-binding NarL/FixJ family response regulator [Catenuloplanes atrovinosus]
MSPPALRVVLIDDHPLFVQGMELLLPRITGGRATVVASTGDAAGAAGLVLRTVADLALVDLHMPAPGGIRAIAAIRRTVARTRIVAMSGDENPEPAVEALRAGAEGFLPKSMDAEALLSPLLSILDGWSVLPSWLLGPLLTPGRGPRPAPPVHLDDAERRLLRLIAAGATTTEIAEELHVSERTVKRLTATLLRKLRVTSRTEAAALAGSAGLI